MCEKEREREMGDVLIRALVKGSGFVVIETTTKSIHTLVMNQFSPALCSPPLQIWPIAYSKITVKVIVWPEN